MPIYNINSKHVKSKTLTLLLTLELYVPHSDHPVQEAFVSLCHAKLLTASEAKFSVHLCQLQSLISLDLMMQNKHKQQKIIGQSHITVNKRLQTIIICIIKYCIKHDLSGKSKSIMKTFQQQIIQDCITRQTHYKNIPIFHVRLY